MLLDFWIYNFLRIVVLDFLNYDKALIISLLFH